MLCGGSFMSSFKLIIQTQNEGKVLLGIVLPTGLLGILPENKFKWHPDWCLCVCIEFDVFTRENQTVYKIHQQIWHLPWTYSHIQNTITRLTKPPILLLNFWYSQRSTHPQFRFNNTVSLSQRSYFRKTIIMRCKHSKIRIQYWKLV